MQRFLFCFLTTLILFSACGGRKEPVVNGAFVPEKRDAASAEGYDLDDITASGELIAVTLSGPDTYFDYQGQPMGLQYALAADFANREGLRLRMETAHDTAELVARLLNGEADLIALPLPLAVVKAKGLQAAGATNKEKTTTWAVRQNSEQLAEALAAWYAANPLVTVTRREQARFAERHQVRRQVRAPYVSREKGIISTYDVHFRAAATTTGWDWRLLAAQCYQESGFDPAAVSWAGARGLMQIMPATARGLGVSPESLYSPEVNIATAARYIAKLNNEFADIRRREERVKFVLAAYNGGVGHVRDAMALARKHGRADNSWEEVSYFVHHLSEARYYRDPVVRYGYMIGSETYNYVNAVIERWRAYGGTVVGAGAAGGEVPTAARAAHRQNRFSKAQDIKTPEELEAQ